MNLASRKTSLQQGSVWPALNHVVHCKQAELPQILCALVKQNHGDSAGVPYLLVDLVAKHAELEALELDDQHSRCLLHSHALGGPHFALLLGADVLVGTIQVLRACEALQGPGQVTGSVDLQAEIQEGVVGVGLVATLCALHLQHPHHCSQQVDCSQSKADLRLL